MPDMNRLIQQWRDSLRGLTAEQADELEDHLRIECDRLAGGDLTTEEQVLIASRRLGVADELKSSFAVDGSPVLQRFGKKVWWSVTVLLAIPLPIMACWAAIISPYLLNPWNDEFFGVFWYLVLPGVLLAGWLVLSLAAWLICRIGQHRGRVRTPRRLSWSVLWTLALLSVYRIGFFVPMPGVDQARLSEWMAASGPGATSLVVDPSSSLRFFNPMIGLLVALWVVGLWWILRLHMNKTSVM